MESDDQRISGDPGGQPGVAGAGPSRSDGSLSGAARATGTTLAPLTATGMAFQPSGESLEILQPEVIDMREELEAKGSETSSTFDSRMMRLCQVLEDLGCSDSTINMAV